MFIDAFAFKSSQRLKFGPDDKVYGVYRSLYPSLGWADSMELETFALDLERVYRIDVSKIPNGDVITLGELFQMVRNPNKSIQGTGASAPVPDL